MSLASTMATMGRGPQIVRGTPAKAPVAQSYTRGGQIGTLAQQRSSVIPFGGGGGGGKKPPPVGTVPLNPYDAFNVADPYDPKTIASTATTGYNTDVANATNLAGMGALTADQINAQAQNRATQQTALGDSLSARLAAIQQAYVGSGNAGATSLAAQNASVAAGAPNIGGVSSGGPAEVPGVAAVLASQTAGGGNLYGGLQAAALSQGNSNAKDALAAGDTLRQTTAADTAGRLATLLSGITSTSARTASMTDANSKVDAANKVTQLAVWQNLKTNELSAQQSGDRKAIAQAALDSKNYLAGLSAKEKLALGAKTNKTKLDVAKIGANAGIKKAGITADAGIKKTKLIVDGKKQAALLTGAKPLSPSQKLSLDKQIAKVMGSPGGVAQTGAPVTSGYSVSLSARMIPGSQTTPDLVNKQGGQTVLLPKSYKPGDTIPGYPNQYVTGSTAKTKAGAKTIVDKPSAQTKWKRALGTVQQVTGLDRTAAAQYMNAAGYPFPKVK